MTRDTVRRQPTASRPRGLALAASAVVVLALLGRQLALLSHTAWQTVLQPGPAALDPTITALCASLALVLVGWLLAAVVISLVAVLLSTSSRAGAAAARGARLVAPTVLRNAMAALLGAAVLGAPLSASAAGLPRPAVSVTDSRPDAGLLPGWPIGGPAAKSPSTGSVVSTPDAPGLSDRLGAPEETAPPVEGRSDPTPSPYSSGPTSSGSTSSGSTAGARSASIRSDLRPGWVPGRPAPARTSVPRQVTPGKPAPVGTAGRRDRVTVDDEIVVHQGDTLWSLAARHLGPGATDGEIATEWPHWFTANRQVIGPDPDRLLPGERLHPPGPGTGSNPARTSRGTIR